MKTPIVSIKLNRGEGPSSECGKPVTVDSWEAAHTTLLAWSMTAPRTGGYDKVDFWLAYRDGYVYQGRFDMKYLLVDGKNRQSLEEHVQSFLLFNAGLYCPSHLTEEKYRDCVKRMADGMGGVDAFRDHIASYDLGAEVVKPNVDVKTPMAKLTCRAKALELWPKLGPNLRAGIRMGLFHTDLIEMIEQDGYEWKPVTDELLRLAGA
jgi:hypothetical protein